MKRGDPVAGGMLLLAALAIVVSIALLFGAQPITWRGATDPSSSDHIILMQIRLPRVLLAAAVGAMLAAAGATFQNLLRNSLADPFILGVSGGAACAAASASVLGLAAVHGGVTMSAFFGAATAMLIVFLLSRKNGVIDTPRLLVSGLVLNSFFSAIILLVLALSSSGDLSNALRWMIGSLAGATWGHVAVAALAALPSLLLFLFIAGDLRLLVFGEDDATSRGVNVDRVKMAGLAGASLATGAAVSVSGIIGFVGLLIPHLVRMLWSDDYRRVLPLSMIAGATLLIAADFVARVAIAPAELPVGALLALLGVPVFVYLLWKS